MYKTNGDILKNNYSQNETTLFTEEIFDEKIKDYIRKNLGGLRFSFFLKDFIISLAALIISFFLDISSVPLLGNISIEVSKSLFPTWVPINQTIKPISFWWLPIITYLVFVLFAYKTFRELRRSIKTSTTPEVIDRIMDASVSVIDGISTALPLIGAAILLISIKLGPEIFLGLSVPFEIKALAILAIGKLFEPVLDEMGVEFQHISSNVNEMKNTHNLSQRIQSIKNDSGSYDDGKLNSLQSLLSTYNQNEVEKFELTLKKIADHTGQILLNLRQSGEITEGLWNLSKNLGSEISEVKELTGKIIDAANSLKDEKTLLALKSLEAIIIRNGSDQNGKEK